MSGINGIGMNGTALSKISGKKDNLARHTQIFPSEFAD